jgi:hypothetical protein
MNKFQKKVTAVTTTTKTKYKAEAEVTEDIQDKVDLFVNNKATLKQLEAEQLTLEGAIVEHVRPQQDEMAFCGSHTKSLKVPGHNYTLTYVTMDKFSVPQDEDSLKAIKDLVKGKYDDMFEAKEKISIKEAVAKDDKLMNKIADACEKAKLDISELFDRVEVIKAKDDLDVKQYELTPKDLEIFRTLVRQAKPSLR